MAELADAHGSGPCGGFSVRVQAPLSAPVDESFFRAIAQFSPQVNPPLAEASVRMQQFFGL